MFTDKWFAHIQNDPHLKGTRNLEGILFHETIGCLIEFVKTIQNKETPMDIDAVNEHIGPLLNKLNYLKQNSMSHVQLRAQFKDLECHELQEREEFTQYTNDLVEKIRNLNSKEADNNSVLISGGWVSIGSGHAMIYEFKKDEQGDLLFLIHNSGAGLNFHHKVQGVDKERFCPVYAYRIPKDSIQEDRLNWFLGELLLPSLRLKNEEPYSEDRLYKELFPKIAYLNGELEDPCQHTRQDNITMGQHSGTCAEKSLHQMVEHAFPDKKTYQQFMYYFKKFALEHYFSRVEEEGTIYKPGVLNQIRLAIENMSRLLLKGDYFDKALRKNEAHFLVSIKNKLSQYQEEYY